MRKKIVLSIVACLIASAFVGGPARADFLDDVLGLLPGFSQVQPQPAAPQQYAGYHAVPGYSPPVYSPPVYSLTPAPQPVPVAPQQVAGTPNRLSYQQASPVPSQKRRSEPLVQAASKQKPVRSSAGAKRVQPAAQKRVANQSAIPRVASTGQRLVGLGAPAALPQSQLPPPVYYPDYLQQYAAPAYSPNYYGGYSYSSGWGPSNPAACPPGRA